jgi:hypothetical protein
MKITHHWNVEREDGTNYTRFFLDDGKTLQLESSDDSWILRGQTGRKISSKTSVLNAIKLVSTYFDEVNA